MTDPQDALDQVKYRERLSHAYEDVVIGLEQSQADVPFLVAAVEAVLQELDDYEVPSKQDDVTGEIGSNMERLEARIRRVLTNRLTGEDDE